MKNKEAANRIFASNPDQKDLFQTADGQFFFAASDANAHAPRCKSKEVAHYEQKDSAFGKELAAKVAVGTGTDDDTEPTLEELKKLPLEDLKNAQLKEVATALEIDLKGLNSNAKLITAIEAARAKAVEVNAAETLDGKEETDAAKEGAEDTGAAGAADLKKVD